MHEDSLLMQDLKKSAVPHKAGQLLGGSETAGTFSFVLVDMMLVWFDGAAMSVVPHRAGQLLEGIKPLQVTRNSADGSLIEHASDRAEGKTLPVVWSPSGQESFWKASSLVQYVCQQIWLHM